MGPVLLYMIIASQCVQVFPQTLTSALNTDESSTTVSTHLPSVPPTLSVLQKWQKFENMTKIFAKQAVKLLVPSLMESSGSMNISLSCRKEFLKLISGLRSIKPWAFSFIDSTGKFIDGMLDGTMSTLGEYDQCLKIKVPEERSGPRKGQILFTGKYCSLDLRPPLPPKKKYYKLNEVEQELRNFSEGGNIISETAKTAHFFHFLAMRVGICIPSGCQVSDIQQILQRIADDVEWSLHVKRCEVKEENEYSPLIIAVMTFYCFFGLLMLIGTSVDVYHYYAQRKINGIPLQMIASFSLMMSFKKLVNTKSSSGNMTCLHGLRVLSITWIILGHTYLNVNYQLFRGLRKATLFQNDFAFQAVVNATVAVDTFFLIGGLLICYVTIKFVRNTKKPFDIGLYLLHRLIRMYPVYIAVILMMFLAPLFGSGPVWHDSTENFINACYKNWWTNLLFINNFVHNYDMCLPQSWYISCDIQLYVAAIFLLLPLIKWPKVGVSLTLLCILASIGGSGAMTYIYEYPPTMLFVHPDHEQRISYWANAYFKPYSHAGPYCVGILLGYLLATKPNLKISMKLRVVGWCCAIATNLAVLYGVWEWNKGRDATVIESVLYSGLHRVGWALGVSWVVLNCHTGQAGVVNYILSWKCWIPIGRLTYAAYLIHPIVQMAAVGNIRMKLMTHHYFAVWMFFGHLMITYGTSFVASMMFEAPFISLEKLFLGRKIMTAVNGTANGKAHAEAPNGHLKLDNTEAHEHGIYTNGDLKLNNHENGIHTNGDVSRL